ncbi:hypothetical protein [Halorubrum depositum]|nr:hypothetical protein [Halorubrum depositum]
MSGTVEVDRMVLATMIDEIEPSLPHLDGEYATEVTIAVNRAKEALNDER